MKNEGFVMRAVSATRKRDDFKLLKEVLADDSFEVGDYILIKKKASTGFEERYREPAKDICGIVLDASKPEYISIGVLRDFRGTSPILYRTSFMKVDIYTGDITVQKMSEKDIYEYYEKLEKEDAAV